MASQIPSFRGLTSMTLSEAWRRLQPLPMGNFLFSKMIGMRIPYSGSIGATVLELSDGHAKIELKDRRAVRNHLNCIHAIALVNLGELCTGLAVFHKLDGKAKGIVTGLRIEYLKKARGTITATADVAIPQDPGKHEFEVAGELRDASGETVARVWAQWQVKM